MSAGSAPIIREHSHTPRCPTTSQLQTSLCVAPTAATSAATQPAWPAASTAREAQAVSDRHCLVTAGLACCPGSECNPCCFLLKQSGWVGTEQLAGDCSTSGRGCADPMVPSRGYGLHLTTPAAALQGCAARSAAAAAPISASTPTVSLVSSRAAPMAVSGSEWPVVQLCCSLRRVGSSTGSAPDGSALPPLLTVAGTVYPETAGTKQICCPRGTVGYTDAWNQPKCCDEGGCLACRQLQSFGFALIMVTQLATHLFT